MFVAVADIASAIRSEESAVDHISYSLFPIFRTRALGRALAVRAPLLCGSFLGQGFALPVNASVMQARPNAFNQPPKRDIVRFARGRRRTCFSVPLRGARPRLTAAAPESRCFASLVQSRPRKARKERTCPTLPNQPPKSRCIRSRQRFG